jgi:hypothetical protein
VKFVLDTNAVSEMAKHGQIKAWLIGTSLKTRRTFSSLRSLSLKFGKASTAWTQLTVNMIESRNLLLGWPTYIAS